MRSLIRIFAERFYPKVRFLSHRDSYDFQSQPRNKYLNGFDVSLCFFRYVPLHIKVGLFEIVGLGTVAGIAATYSAMQDLIANKFTVPCYVNPAKA